jgi:L-threonylcarbamoyladenylate synthase
METPPVSHRTDESLREQVQTAVRVLKGGGVVSVPTDTLYGLAASAFDERALERLYRIKGRSRSMALPLLLASPDEIVKYTVDVPEITWKLAERFFPGALTLVLHKAERVPDLVSGGLDTVAIRVPDHWVPREIVRELGVPITGTSANRSGTPGLTTAQAVRDQLGGEIDYVIDGGNCPGGIASTVLDVSGPWPIIIREGAVSRRVIEEVCGVQVAVRD